jgi:dihydrofolate reductase
VALARQADLRAHLTASARGGPGRSRRRGRQPGGLLDRLRAAGLARDAFLLGGRRTLHAFLALGAIDRLELLEFPVILGDGVPFSPPGTPQLPLELEEHHVFPDGTVRHVYTLAGNSA